jgi:DNA-binding FrmR family transcriptional regulator
MRALTSRRRRAEGQVRAVARLIEEGEPCEVVAQQLTAARRALDRTFFEMIGCALQHGQIALLTSLRCWENTLEHFVEY